jgi:hypothetical protein
MKYEIELAMTGTDNCWCQKSQLACISCNHLLTVCSFKRLDYTQYVSLYCTIKYYINTWSGHWHNYDNSWDWPMYNDSIIMPDPAKINKGMRRKIRIPMIMGEIDGHINRMPTRGRARSSKAWLDYQFVYLIYHYICQND